MKVEFNDIQSLEENPIQSFYNGFKSPATKERYTRILKRILCNIFENILKGTFEERASQFVKKAKSDPDWAMSVLLSLSNKLRQRTELPRSDKNYFNPSSFGNYFKPIKKLLDMNGVPVSWKRVYATFPEEDNTNEGRGYTIKEIQTILSFTSGPMDRAIVLIASSSGIREGGFSLKWKDVMPVYKVDDKILLEITESQEKKAKVICAILQIYQGTPESIPAFITPEAYNALMDWKTAWITEVGRESKLSDPIFKVEGSLPKMLKPTAIKRRVERILINSGLRKPLPKGIRRHDVPVMNGFRRFFNKVNKESFSKDSPLASLIKKEYMMSHTGLIKLDRNYFQTHVLELVEEYLNAIPNLTISDDERTKAENERLRKEKSELERKTFEIEDLKKSVLQLHDELERRKVAKPLTMADMKKLEQRLQKVGINI